METQELFDKFCERCPEFKSMKNGNVVYCMKSLRHVKERTFRAILARNIDRPKFKWNPFFVRPPDCDFGLDIMLLTQEPYDATFDVNLEPPLTFYQ